jgi:predicted amidophosphoribosyltransferase
MSRRDPVCPVCDADVPLTGDEMPGEEVFCPYCSAPSRVRARGEEECELEPDY